MPKNTFLIKDILNESSPSTTSTHVDYKRQSVSPAAAATRLVKKPKIDVNPPIVNPPETFMGSLFAAAQYQQQQQYSALYLSGTTADTDPSSLYMMKSPKSYSSSSSSLSSTSPISSTSSSQFSHEQLVNQFYQRLLFLNLQNSLSRIQQQNGAGISGGVENVFASYNKQNIPSNKENDESESSEYDSMAQSSDTDMERRKLVLKNQKRASSSSSSVINKSFSTSSLKTSDDLDETNSDHGHCSTPIHDKNNSTSSHHSSNVSPLDALLQMANTTFMNNTNNMILGGTHQYSLQQQQQQQQQDKCSAKLNASAIAATVAATITPTLAPITSPGNSIIDIISNSSSVQQQQQASVLANKLNQSSIIANDSLSKRKRKNRTAFTAHQIYELEKRFSSQKYLSPSDRDRISQELSLSTAQVITWFQNRRAKQKRDVEEMKNDLLAAKSLCGAHSSNDDDGLSSSCGYSNHHSGHQHHQIYNDSIENDCQNDDSSQCESDISLGSPNTSLS